MMQILQPPGWARAKGFSNGIAAQRQAGVHRRPGRLDRPGRVEGEILRRPVPPGAPEHPRGAGRGARQARAHRAPHLVRARQAGVSRLAEGSRRRLPRADGQALPDDGGGAGERPGRGRGAPRDRSHGGDPDEEVSIIGGGPGGLYFALLAKKAWPRWDITVYERNRPGRHLRLRRGVLRPDARRVQGLRPRHLRAHPAALRLLGRRRRGLQGPGDALGRQRLLRLLARGAAQHPAGPRPRARRADALPARGRGAGGVRRFRPDRGRRRHQLAASARSTRTTSSRASICGPTSSPGWARPSRSTPSSTSSARRPRASSSRTATSTSPTARPG